MVEIKRNHRFKILKGEHQHVSVSSKLKKYQERTRYSHAYIVNMKRHVLMDDLRESTNVEKKVDELEKWSMCCSCFCCMARIKKPLSPLLSLSIIPLFPYFISLIIFYLFVKMFLIVHPFITQFTSFPNKTLNKYL